MAFDSVSPLMGGAAVPRTVVKWDRDIRLAEQGQQGTRDGSNVQRGVEDLCASACASRRTSLSSDELKYLTMRRVCRASRKPKRKSRGKLARRAAELAASEVTRIATSPSDALLVQADVSAMIPAVGDAGAFQVNQCPTVTSTHWEWTLYSWMSRSITPPLLSSIAAKIIR